MAIRWSAKGRRFYDDQTGYPTSREHAARSSIARDDYRRTHPAHPFITHPEIFVPKDKREKGYEVRPLSEEFAEELAGFDGTTKAQSMNRYADILADQEPDVYEQEDRYSED
ncbi:MAG: hypothetical protein KGJ13_06405 [Patescibacteria group bacterium]|nr:hypothetical protein [Patescibacteria group bacterium]